MGMYRNGRSEVASGVGMMENTYFLRLGGSASIISEDPHSNKTDLDNDAREPGVFDCELALLFILGTED